MSHRRLTKEALQKKRAKGERTGSIPYGKQLAADGVHLEDNEAEQRVLDRILRMRSERLSIRKIVERLNLTETPARGSRWHAASVHRILKRICPGASLSRRRSEAAGINDKLVSLRISAEAIERAEALIEPLSHLPNLRAAAVNRSATLRLAIQSGLDVLEKEAREQQA